MAFLLSATEAQTPPKFTQDQCRVLRQSGVDVTGLCPPVPRKKKKAMRAILILALLTGCTTAPVGVEFDAAQCRLLRERRQNVNLVCRGFEGTRQEASAAAANASGSDNSGSSGGGNAGSSGGGSHNSGGHNPGDHNPGGGSVSPPSPSPGPSPGPGPGPEPPDTGGPPGHNPDGSTGRPGNPGHGNKGGANPGHGGENPGKGKGKEN